MTNLEIMYLARLQASHSTCQRRKIGVIFRAGEFRFTGVNHPAVPCIDCKREEGDCPAIHAEVSALIGAEHYALCYNTELYIWAEIPCRACLSAIHKLTDGRCKIVHCLSAESYAAEYPRVTTNQENLLERAKYAKELNIGIVTYDRNMILAIQE